MTLRVKQSSDQSRTLRMKQSSDQSRAVRTGIAKRLREAYEEMLAEEIPLRHRDLLQQIEHREQPARGVARDDAATARRH